MTEESLAPKVTPFLVRRVRDLCPRRLDLETRSEPGSDDPVNRSRVRDAFLDAVRTAHTLEVPLDRAPWQFPPDVTAEERVVLDQAAHWYRHLFGDRTVTLVDHDLDRPSEVAGLDVRIGGWVDLTVEDHGGVRELRQLDFWARRAPVRVLDDVGVRLALLRLEAWLGTDPVGVSWTDLLHGVRREELLDPVATLTEIRADLDDEVAVLRARAATAEALPGADCATCRFGKGCPEFPKAITVRTRKGDVRPAVLSLTPTAVETWVRCRRLFHSQHLLGLPASDSSTPGVHGLQVHALLRALHRDGPCDDPTRVDDVVVAHGADTRVLAELRDHARRCPTGAASYGHEITRARLYARYPNFLASARIDAAWVHDGLLDVRDYKTGGVSYPRVAEDPRARLQVWVMAPVAESLGLRLRIRYEHLATEIVDDPDDWEPEADDVAAITEELETLALEIRAETEWRGVSDPTVCGTCRYRSMCPDSATPGVPAWPRVDADADPPEDDFA